MSIIVCSAVMLVGESRSSVIDAFHPLAPPDRSSPRATLTTFLDEMNMAVAEFRAGHRDPAIIHADRAMRCLNLAEEPPAIRDVLGFYSALYLKETLDRIEIPSLEVIPDAHAAAVQFVSFWISRSSWEIALCSESKIGVPSPASVFGARALGREMGCSSLFRTQLLRT
ncbi:MAG: hypothetical protein LDL33_12995 [Desulfomonile sp.]|nr:hypothetical protein [Desulfomonile sp.]